MTRLFKINVKRSFAIIFIFIVAVALFKDIRPIETDKVVYVEIGNKIEQLSSMHCPVGVAGRSSVPHMWITFYANVKSNKPVCHQAFTLDSTSMLQMKELMHLNRMTYLLWEEVAWKKSSFGHNASEFLNDFEELGRWHHKDTGDLVLFRLRKTNEQG